MNRLILPLVDFHRFVIQLHQTPGQSVWCRVGYHQADEGTEWLGNRSVMGAAVPSDFADGPMVRITLSPEAPADPATSIARLPHAVVGALWVGSGHSRGRLWSICRTGERAESLDILSLVGSGMHRLMTPVRGGSSMGTPEPSALPGEERWSRTIAALGGAAVWQRLVQLPMGVIGAGRTGSLVAAALARSGVCRLTLIDPDRLEEHNLSEMEGVADTDLGLPKVEALVASLSRVSPQTTGSLEPIAFPLHHPAAVTAAKACSVLFCCADNDAARLASALLASIYHRVLVDIGTGILAAFTPVDAAPRSIGQRFMGADVRLILPGDGCLLCRGSLTDFGRAVDDLSSHRMPADLAPAWRLQRAGSLRSLNQIAVGLALRMLEDLVAERLQNSTWARAEFDPSGRLVVQYPPRTASEDSSPCQLCARAGLGDAALA